MKPRPNLCARCGLPMAQEDEDGAADRGEPLYESACLECHFDKCDGDLDETILNAAGGSDRNRAAQKLADCQTSEEQIKLNPVIREGQRRTGGSQQRSSISVKK